MTRPIYYPLAGILLIAISFAGLHFVDPKYFSILDKVCLSGVLLFSIGSGICIGIMLGIDIERNRASQHTDTQGK